MIDPRAEHLARHNKLKDYLGCSYCGITKNTCDRARQPRPNQYKDHRSTKGRN